MRTFIQLFNRLKIKKSYFIYKSKKFWPAKQKWSHWAAEEPSNIYTKDDFSSCGRNVWEEILLRWPRFDSSKNNFFHGTIVFLQVYSYKLRSEVMLNWHHHYTFILLWNMRIQFKENYPLKFLWLFCINLFSMLLNVHCAFLTTAKRLFYIVLHSVL